MSALNVTVLTVADALFTARLFGAALCSRCNPVCLPPLLPHSAVSDKWFCSTGHCRYLPLGLKCEYAQSSAHSEFVDVSTGFGYTDPNRPETLTPLFPPNLTTAHIHAKAYLKTRSCIPCIRYLFVRIAHPSAIDVVTAAMLP